MLLFFLQILFFFDMGQFMVIMMMLMAIYGNDGEDKNLDSIVLGVGSLHRSLVVGGLHQCVFMKKEVLMVCMIY